MRFGTPFKTQSDLEKWFFKSWYRLLVVHFLGHYFKKKGRTATGQREVHSAGQRAGRVRTHTSGYEQAWPPQTSRVRRARHACAAGMLLTGQLNGGRVLLP